MATDKEPDSIIELLNLTGRELSQVVGLLNKADRHLLRAYNIAVIGMRPSVQIEHLRGEIRTLNQIVSETITELIRKAAEVEAGSEG